MEITKKALEAGPRSARQSPPRYPVEREPADLAAFAGFSDLWNSAEVSAKIGWRDPVLALAGKDMVNHIEKMKHLDGKTVFFLDLTLQSVLEGLTELNASSGKLPGVALVACMIAAAGKEDLSGLVEDDGAGADTDIIDTLLHGP